MAETLLFEEAAAGALSEENPCPLTTLVGASEVMIAVAGSSAPVTPVFDHASSWKWDAAGPYSNSAPSSRQKLSELSYSRPHSGHRFIAAF